MTSKHCSPEETQEQRKKARPPKSASTAAHTHLPAMCRRCLVLDLDPLPRPLHPACNTTTTKQSKENEYLIHTEDRGMPYERALLMGLLRVVAPLQMQRCSMATAIRIIELPRPPGSLRRTCHAASAVLALAAFPRLPCLLPILTNTLLPSSTPAGVCSLPYGLDDDAALAPTRFR